MKKLLLLALLFIGVKVFAQVPTITGISAYSSQPGKTVYITGYNFSGTASNNIVRFGNVKATILAATTTQLNVTVPYGASNGQISVTTGGLTGYSSFDFIPTFPGATPFSSTNAFGGLYNVKSRTNTTLGYTPFTLIRLGDIDGDGKTDIVTGCQGTSYPPDSAILIFRNLNSPGSVNSFAAPYLVNHSPTPYTLKIQFIFDMNADGKLDLISQNGDSIYVFLNNSIPGSISFSSNIIIPLTVSRLTIYDIGDLDQDGKPDILFLRDTSIYASTIPTIKSIYCLKNNATSSSFNSSTFSVVKLADINWLSNGTYLLKIKDMNSDLKPEIISCRRYQPPSVLSDSILIFQNNCTSGYLDSTSFGTPVIIHSNYHTQDLRLNDLDGDGKPELITFTSYAANADTVSVFKNISGSTMSPSSFASRVSNVGYQNYGMFSVSDMSGDGMPDMVFYESSPGNRFKISNSSTTPFNSTTYSSSFLLVDSIDNLLQDYYNIFSDMDNDGRPDLVLLRKSYINSSHNNFYLSIYRNLVQQAAPSTPGVLYATSSTGGSITLLALPGNGAGRVIMARAGTATFYADTPTNNTAYTANTVFGSGSQVKTGLYMVSKVTGDSTVVITITGLSPNTTYYFSMVEFNGLANSVYLNSSPYFTSRTTLPVILTSFTAQKQNENVLLKWQTASELNNDYFEIQRSVDGSQFRAIGKVKGNGTSNVVNSYQFTDVSAPLDITGTLYYKLKQVDFDGKFEYSNIVSINFDQIQTNELSIYPNPNKGEFEIRMNKFTGSTTFEVYDMIGNKVYEDMLTSASSHIHLSNLHQGVYFFRCNTSEGVINKKIVLE